MAIAVPGKAPASRRRLPDDGATRPMGLPLKQIDHVPLHERVYREVRHALVSGHFEPGLKLTVRDMAAALGTSPMPVRAALSRLVAERALTQIDMGSAMVPVVSRAAFRDLMEARILLEGHAAKLSTPRFRAQDLAQAKALAGKLNACIDQDDIVDYLRLNRALKFAIYSRCGSDALIALIESLWLQVGPFLRHLAKDIKGLEKINYHDDALAAIERGDDRAARTFLQRDIREGMRFILRTAEFGTTRGARTKMGSAP